MENFEFFFPIWIFKVEEDGSEGGGVVEGVGGGIGFGIGEGHLGAGLAGFATAHAATEATGPASAATLVADCLAGIFALFKVEPAVVVAVVLFEQFAIGAAKTGRATKATGATGTEGLEPTGATRRLEAFGGLGKRLAGGQNQGPQGDVAGSLAEPKRDIHAKFSS